MSMVIVGAGLSGCIAGLLNPGVKLIEAGARRTEHQAVLRFREAQIGRALGIPFQPVQVLKSAYMQGKHFTAPDPRLCNLYARKVTGGKVSARSIGDLRPVERWVAPADFHALMLERLGDRVRFNARVERITADGMVINGAEHHD